VDEPRKNIPRGSKYSDEYRKNMKELQKYKTEGGFFIFQRIYIQFLSRDEALFLQDLINIGAMATKPGEIWFACGVTRLKNSLNFDKDTQRRIIQKLISLELIKVKYDGLPRRRYFRINWKVLDATLDRILDEQIDRELQPVEEDDDI
jgi:hypothetical protein